MAVDEALAEACGTDRQPARSCACTVSARPRSRWDGSSPRRACSTAGALEADGVTLVRRPTGGHAVLHDSELTYVGRLPRRRSGPLAGSLAQARRVRVHRRILAGGLANLGVQGVINASQNGDVHNPDCFGSAGEFEIADLAGRKIIGSAQMTTRTAILQHGSIPSVNPGPKVFRYLRAEQPLDVRDPPCLPRRGDGDASRIRAGARRLCRGVQGRAARPGGRAFARGRRKLPAAS